MVVSLTAASVAALYVRVPSELTLASALMSPPKKMISRTASMVVVVFGVQAGDIDDVDDVDDVDGVDGVDGVDDVDVFATQQRVAPS